jgi:hypothetical protein
MNFYFHLPDAIEKEDSPLSLVGPTVVPILELQQWCVVAALADGWWWLLLLLLVVLLL